MEGLEEFLDVRELTGMDGVAGMGRAPPPCPSLARMTRMGQPAYRLQMKFYLLVVLALPLFVGALEVFDCAVIEVPEAGGDFVDQVVVVRD